MDKAEAWMSSWGWQPGHGLGKQETGIVDPLKASIKNDKLGVCKKGYFLKLLVYCLKKK